MKRKILFFSLLYIFYGLFLIGNIHSQILYFIDYKNGIILDKRNNRHWQKCAYGQQFYDDRCIGREKAVSYETADAYCKTLRLQNKKWKLPSIRELASLSDVFYDKNTRRGETIFINLDFFPASHPYEYWSNSYYISSRGISRLVYSFLYKYRFAVIKGNFFVRCITKEPKS